MFERLRRLERVSLHVVQGANESAQPPAEIQTGKGDERSDVHNVIFLRKEATTLHLWLQIYRSFPHYSGPSI